MASDPPDGALQGLRVLEVGDQGTQYCGKVLADMGAEVIKIEPPEGAASRRAGPFRNDALDVNGSLTFWAWNTSKKSIVLDLRRSQDRRALRRLVATSDVLLEDYPPGHLDSLGLGYQRLAKENATLLYTSVSPFGQSGPLRDWKGGDLVQWAMGGNMWLVGYTDPETPPLLPEGGHSWILGGLWASIGTLMALHQRDRTGRGQHVDVSIQDACCLSTQMAVPVYEYMGQVLHRRDHGRVLRCSDGQYVYPQMVNIGPDVWQRLVAWLDKRSMAEDLGDDRFLDPDVLGQNLGRVLDVLEKTAATMTSDELWRAGQRMGLTWMRVNAPEDLLEDEQLIVRGFYQRVEHPEFQQAFLYPGPAYLYSETPWAIRRRPPLLGEDQALLGQVLDQSRRPPRSG